MIESYQLRQHSIFFDVTLDRVRLQDSHRIALRDPTLLILLVHLGNAQLLTALLVNFKHVRLVLTNRRNEQFDLLVALCLFALRIFSFLGRLRLDNLHEHLVAGLKLFKQLDGKERDCESAVVYHACMQVARQRL